MKGSPKAAKAAGAPSQADRGAPGPAAAARPRITVQVATGERGLGRESAEALRYLDAHLVDRLHQRAQINDRQHEAGALLLRLAIAAGVVQSPTPAYAEGLARQSTPPARHDGDVNRPTAADLYNRAMRRMSQAHDLILRAMLQGEHPGVARLATLQAALDAMAGALRVPVDFVWSDPEWDET